MGQFRMVGGLISSFQTATSRISLIRLLLSTQGFPPISNPSFTKVHIRTVFNLTDIFINSLAMTYCHPVRNIHPLGLHTPAGQFRITHISSCRLKINPKCFTLHSILFREISPPQIQDHCCLQCLLSSPRGQWKPRAILRRLEVVQIRKHHLHLLTPLVCLQGSPMALNFPTLPWLNLRNKLFVLSNHRTAVLSPNRRWLSQDNPAFVTIILVFEIYHS